MNSGSSSNSRALADAGRRERRERLLIGSAGLLIGCVIAVGTLVTHGLTKMAGRPPGAPRPVALASGSPGPRIPARPPVGRIGRYQVARWSLRLTDRSRPELGAAVLPTLVRYPVVPAREVAAGKYSRGPFPLVVFAPGYLQCRSSYSSLLRTWASAGYVVAAVEFPRTSCHVTAPDEADLSNQPADISLVITRLTAISGRPAGVLSGLIDSREVAVAGHSDGGDAAAAVAANTCCLDRRVTAALILSGAQWPPLGGRYFPRGTPPMLFVQGTADTWNPPEASVQLYTGDTNGIRYYLDLPGAGHFAPYQGHGRPEPLVARVTVDFLNRYLAGQVARARAMAADGTVRGEAVLNSGGRLPP